MINENKCDLCEERKATRTLNGSDPDNVTELCEQCYQTGKLELRKLEPLDSNNLVTSKDFEQSITLNVPNQIGWAVMQYKSAIEIVRQKDEKIDSLITTIESQKEEIEKLTRKNLNAVDYAVRGLLDEAGLTAEIESLKAITELAVKGLEKIRIMEYEDLCYSGNDALKMNEIAIDTLSEIERLQNASTS